MVIEATLGSPTGSPAQAIWAPFRIPDPPHGARAGAQQVDFPMEIEEFCQHFFGKWPMQLGALLDKDWTRNLRNLIFRDPTSSQFG